jgi:hypothetical protein
MVLAVQVVLAVQIVRAVHVARAVCVWVGGGMCLCGSTSECTVGDGV